MLDIKFIRENSDIIKLAAEKKRIAFEIKDLIDIDDKRLILLKSVEELRTRQNQNSDRIPTLSGVERVNAIEAMQVLKEELKKGANDPKAIPRLRTWGESLCIALRAYLDMPSSALGERAEMVTLGDKLNFLIDRFFDYFEVYLSKPPTPEESNDRQRLSGIAQTIGQLLPAFKKKLASLSKGP